MKYMIKHVPIPIAGLVLGLTALGNLLQEYSDMMRTFCGLVAGGLGILLLLKFVIYPFHIKEEYENPIIASVSATIFMSVMQLMTYIFPYVGKIAYVIWLAAVCSHLILMVWYTKKFLLRFSLEEIFPTCFITYVGIIVGSVTSATFQQERLGEMLFWLGFTFYIFIFGLITYRYMKVEVPESAKPLFCIYTAPMSLSLAGYLTASSHISFAFTLALEIMAQLLYIVVLTQLPKLVKLSFYPSFAAFSFPFVITAFALKKWVGYLSSMGIEVSPAIYLVLAIETIIAVVMVSFALIHFLSHLYRHMRLGISAERTQFAAEK